METKDWPYCDHPRVPENTSGVRPKDQCRTCKTAGQRRRYADDPAFAESERARARGDYDALDGVGYNRRLLLMRRQKALARRRQREMGV